MATPIHEGGDPPVPGVVGSGSHPCAYIRTRVRETSTVTGMLSQLHVEQALLKRGCQLFRPVLESSQIDLIALTPGGRYWRIQIKTARIHRQRGKTPAIRLDIRRKTRTAKGVRVNGPRYDQIDVFCVVHHAECWVVPFPDIKQTMNLKIVDSEYHEAWSLMGLTLIENPPSRGSSAC